MLTLFGGALYYVIDKKYNSISNYTVHEIEDVINEYENKMIYYDSKGDYYAAILSKEIRDDYKSLLNDMPSRSEFRKRLQQVKDKRIKIDREIAKYSENKR
jgi:hypothetical protein